jgi:hypothetical protein
VRSGAAARYAPTATGAAAADAAGPLGEAAEHAAARGFYARRAPRSGASLGGSGASPDARSQA